MKEQSKCVPQKRGQIVEAEVKLQGKRGKWSVDPSTITRGEREKDFSFLKFEKGNDN